MFKRTGTYASVYCTLYSVNATGVPLTLLHTSDAYPGASISTTTFDWHTLTFSNYKLEKGTMYAFSWEIEAFHGIGE